MKSRTAMSRTLLSCSTPSSIWPIRRPCSSSALTGSGLAVGSGSGRLGGITTWRPIVWSTSLFRGARCSFPSAIIRTIRSILRQPDYVPNVWERLEGLDRWNEVERLHDRPGEPLNLLSLRQVRNILHASRFELSAFQTHGFSGQVNPVARALAGLSHIPLLRELFHSYYTAVLVKSQIVLNPAPSPQFEYGVRHDPAERGRRSWYDRRSPPAARWSRKEALGRGIRPENMRSLCWY